MTYVVVLTCATCGDDLWAEGFAAVRKVFATLAIAELEARFLGWKLDEDVGWVCHSCLNAI